MKYSSWGILLSQQRFQLILVLLVVTALGLGLLVVPVEVGDKTALITTPELGIWWAVTTLTGVGYGDVYPVTSTGRLIGMGLELVGVVAFGLLVAMVAVAIERKEERWYWSRLFKRFDELEIKIKQVEKKEEFAIKNGTKTQE